MLLSAVTFRVYKWILFLLPQRDEHMTKDSINTLHSLFYMFKDKVYFQLCNTNLYVLVVTNLIYLAEVCINGDCSFFLKGRRSLRGKKILVLLMP
jgi:hypothetical protein